MFNSIYTTSQSNVLKDIESFKKQIHEENQQYEPDGEKLQKLYMQTLMRGLELNPVTYQKYFFN